MKDYRIDGPDEAKQIVRDHRERDGEVIINYVTEVRSRLTGEGWRPWITWPDGQTPATDEAIGRASYRGALLSRHSQRSQFRLVKRTAIVTDVVLLLEERS